MKNEMVMKENAQLPAKECGAAAVEFAIVIGVLLLVVAGIIEFGRAFWYYDALAKATRDGARFMSTVPAATINSTGVATARTMVINAATAARVSPALTDANVSVTCDSGSCVNGTAPAYVSVGITAYSLTLGEWIPFVLPLGGSTASYTVLPAPYTTMRYMQ